MSIQNNHNYTNWQKPAHVINVTTETHDTTQSECNTSTQSLMNKIIKMNEKKNEICH